MAFDLDNLNSGAQPSGQTVSIHSYETSDSQGTVEGGSYFDSVINRVDEHDLLYVVYDKGGSPAGVLYRISKSGGSISLNTIVDESP